MNQLKHALKSIFFVYSKKLLPLLPMFFCTVVFAQDSFNDIVILHSGKEIRCRIVSETPSKIRLITEAGTQSSCSMEQIERIRRNVEMPKVNDSGLNNAENEVTVYKVILKNDLQFYCQILNLDTGNSMLVKKDGGGMVYLQWSEIKAYEATKYSLQGKEMNEIREREKIKHKYANWPDCLIILNKNDTIKRWVEFKGDYSVMGEGEVRTIKVATEKGEEYKLEPEEYKELIILGKDTFVYITLAPTGGDYKNIYRVIENGPCKILFDHYIGRSLAPTIGTMGVSAGAPSIVSYLSVAGSSGSERERDRYYLLYKNKWLKVKLKEGFTIAPSFIDNFKDIFSECAGLSNRIETQKEQTLDLRKIVDEFNTCVMLK